VVLNSNNKQPKKTFHSCAAGDFNPQQTYNVLAPNYNLPWQPGRVVRSLVQAFRYKATITEVQGGGVLQSLFIHHKVARK
jgi:hypothetical protein